MNVFTRARVRPAAVVVTALAGCWVAWRYAPPPAPAPPVEQLVVEPRRWRRTALVGAGGAAGWLLLALVLPPAIGIGLLAALPLVAYALRSEGDAAAFLSLYLLAAFVLPARLVVGAVGGAGTPANLVGVALLGAWIVAQLRPGRRPGHRGVRPLRSALLLFLAAVVISHVAGTASGMGAEAARASERGLLVVAAMIGVFLVAADGLDRRDRLEALLERLVLLAAAVAAVGLLQHLVRLDIAPAFRSLPFLDPVSELSFIRSKAGVRRVSGTALHPIELGAMLAIVWPLAVHHALHRREWSALRRWVPMALITAALPLTASRGAMIGLAVAVAVVSATWSTRVRLQALATGVVLLSVLSLVAPVVLGNVGHLFRLLTSGRDPSVLARTSDYEVAGGLMARSPWFGTGIFTVPHGIVFDNEYLRLLVETGAVGTVALLVVFAAGWRHARRVARQATDQETRSLAQALGAGTLVAAISFAFVDALHFPMLCGTTFLLLGAVAALARSQPRAAVRRP